jgi:hypothetical protein
VSIKTNDAALEYDYLNYDALAPIVAEAISRWTAALDLDAAAVAELSSVNFVITDLPAASLGMVLGDTIYIDIDAAGMTGSSIRLPGMMPSLRCRTARWRPTLRVRPTMTWIF